MSASEEELHTSPFSMQAEEAVIGGLLINNEAWHKIHPIVTEEDFYKKEHRALFRAITKLANSEEPFDAVTLAEQLNSSQLSTPSAMAHLTTLANETPSAANIEYYAKIVLDKSIRRRLIKAATGIIEESRRPSDEEAQKLLDRAEQNILDVSRIQEKQSKEFAPLHVISKEVYEQIQERSQNPDSMVGLKTGFREFDQKTQGFHKGDLIIVAGRPSMGKTSLALNFISHIAIELKSDPIAIFSMEMSSSDLAMRFYSALACVNLQAIRSGQLKKGEDWASLASSLSLMADTKIFIDDSPSLTPLDISARVRRLQREHQGLAMVVVDYMQLMNFQGSVDNRVDEISKISRSLKALAREMDIPVLVLSQLNRAVESREDKRPRMADLRESGAIEQDADLIVFIYREKQYDREKEGEDIAEINIAKHRNGPTFMTRLKFKGELCRFENEDAYLSDERYSEITRNVAGPFQPEKEDIYLDRSQEEEAIEDV